MPALSILPRPLPAGDRAARTPAPQPASFPCWGPWPWRVAGGGAGRARGLERKADAGKTVERGAARGAAGCYGGGGAHTRALREGEGLAPVLHLPAMTPRSCRIPIASLATL